MTKLLKYLAKLRFRSQTQNPKIYCRVHTIPLSNLRQIIK